MGRGGRKKTKPPSFFESGIYADKCLPRERQRDETGGWGVCVDQVLFFFGASLIGRRKLILEMVGYEIELDVYAG